MSLVDLKAWRAANPDKLRAQWRRHNQRHREKRNAYNKEYKKRNKQKIADYDAKYRRTPEKLRRIAHTSKIRRDAHLEQMAGRPRPELCELCGKFKASDFDHCHASGNFRGWLCKPCNRALGFVRDDIEVLKKMIAYLSLQ